MIEGIQLKVCGLRTAADAQAAARVGADYLGFNFYPASPRAITREHYRSLAAQLPANPKVAVTVEPSPEDLAALLGAGFSAFQIHFRTELAEAHLAAWAASVGPERLWLAPKLPPGEEVAPAWLPYARTWLLDTFQPGAFGGSGRVGDWDKFRRHLRAHPGSAWILAGGLNAENVGAALRASGATFVDANSGVESAPGVKDPAKLNAFAASVRAERLRAPAAGA
jgi:phosphoribosylanthranilate isomerase